MSTSLPITFGDTNKLKDGTFDDNNMIYTFDGGTYPYYILNPPSMVGTVNIKYFKIPITGSTYNHIFYIPETYDNLKYLCANSTIGNNIVTTKMTTMERLFEDNATITGNTEITRVGTWDTSSVRNMSNMFSGAKLFNGDLSSWDTSLVMDMNRMFLKAYKFNGNLSSWNTSSVTDMSYLFQQAFIFNGDVASWNTSSVTKMNNMFSNAKLFNDDVASWNTSSVTNMSNMFSNARGFNGDLSSWDTSLVMDMNRMFFNAIAFNGDLSRWDVSKVTNFTSMFGKADAFEGKGDFQTNWKLVSVSDGDDGTKNVFSSTLGHGGMHDLISKLLTGGYLDINQTDYPMIVAKWGLPTTAALTTTSGTSGDPYVTTFSGDMYKLPNASRIYRLLETEHVTVNASVGQLPDSYKTKIMERQVDMKNKHDYDVSLVQDGYFYESFFISFGDKYIIFDRDITISECNFETIPEEMMSVNPEIRIHNCPIQGEQKFWSVVLKLDGITIELQKFINPQVINGISVTKNASIESKGLLSSTLHPKNFTTKHIKSVTPVKLSHHNKNTKPYKKQITDTFYDEGVFNQ
jgi:surface protein